MIQLKNVSKYYYSKGMIASGISKVDLRFELGEFVVITGESGSGKTTLLNVISGLDSYEEGEMYIRGEETSHYIAADFEEYRKRYIGNIFQDFNLVNSYTVYQNIELILLINGYSGEEIRKRVPAIIQRVGLTSHAKTKVSRLSGGQKQRVAIARALAKDTDIVVADEPTGNLDSTSAEGIVKLLSEIAKDKLVIVVTHNYEQFAPYATRRIKMHDGKVAEDVTLRGEEKVFDPMLSAALTKTQANTPAPADDPAPAKQAARSMSTPTDAPHAPAPRDKRITAGGKLKLGVRNTFNIFSKFALLLIVFLFVAFGVTSQYTTFLHQRAEESKLGYNDYFHNYSENRIVLKKVDDSEFTGDDLTVLRNVTNVDDVVLNDIMLDTWLYIESGDFSYETYPHVADEFKGALKEGRMPATDNEAVLTVSRDDYYFGEEMIDDTLEEIMGQTYNISLGDEKDVVITIVGFAFMDQDEDAARYAGHAGKLYVTENLMNTMRTEIYHSNSATKVTLNNRELIHYEGSAYCRVVPHGNVAAGTALIFQEANNFYGEAGAVNQPITITSETMYYTQPLTLTVADVYNKDTFAQKTGFTDFDAYNGAIYINPADYNTLYGKGNYQASVYVDDMDLLDETVKTLENTGYTTMPLKDTLISYTDSISSIIKGPMAVILVIVMFFIAYFVIRLIMKSRAVYFSILRLLGMAKKSIRRIIDVELLLVANLAYGIFLAFIVLVKNGYIRIQYVVGLVEYMDTADFAVLYAVILIMAYLISGKFAKSLFKGTAMETYREEGRTW